LSVTVLTGYNSANLEAMGIKITHCKAEFYEIGLSEILSNSGNVLRVYDKERTMCDIIKKRNELDVSLFNNAIREYAFRSDKKLNNLFHYAKEMNMEKTVRKTIEILL
ncbi:MAG: abortive phage infection protein, partial [Clostridiales bacterium]|nr:abortive phage infection protein [Clostridiales bacterium]